MNYDDYQEQFMNIANRNYYNEPPNNNYFFSKHGYLCFAMCPSGPPRPDYNDSYYPILNSNYSEPYPQKQLRPPHDDCCPKCGCPDEKPYPPKPPRPPHDDCCPKCGCPEEKPYPPKPPRPPHDDCCPKCGCPEEKPFPPKPPRPPHDDCCPKCGCSEEKPYPPKPPRPPHDDCCPKCGCSEEKPYPPKPPHDDCCPKCGCSEEKPFPPKPPRPPHDDCCPKCGCSEEKPFSPKPPRPPHDDCCPKCGCSEEKPFPPKPDGNSGECFCFAQMRNVLKQIIKLYPNDIIEVIMESGNKIIGRAVELFPQSCTDMKAGLLQIINKQCEEEALSIYKIASVRILCAVYNDNLTYLPVPKPLPQGCSAECQDAISAYLPVGTKCVSIKTNEYSFLCGTVKRNIYGMIVLIEPNSCEPIFVSTCKAEVIAK